MAKAKNRGVPNFPASQRANTFRGEFFSGPFPPPDMLERYEKAQPGLTDRIFNFAEAEQGHRHKAQMKQLSIEEYGTKAGFRSHLIASFFVTLMFVAVILAGCYALSKGHTKTSLAIFAVPLFRMAVPMLKTARPNSADRRGG